MNKHLLIASIFLGICSLSACGKKQPELHIYNWSDYIAENTIADFEKRTGIKVTYDVYDSNEVLEAKLLVGKSGYDLVFPTARPFVDRHIKSKIYQPLDKSKLGNLGNVDTVIAQSLSDIDPGNNIVVPYMWGTTGIGYNVDKVKAILGNDMPLDTWRLVFDPLVAEKLKDCGVALMDDPTEVFIAAEAYIGKDINDFSEKTLTNAASVINAVRPMVRYFHSSQYINDLANGDICVAMGYSGDILQARDRASEAANGVTIAYVAPAEGAVVWTDVMAIPADAPNPEAAHLFINYLLEPQVIADITNYVAYANANSASTALIDAEISGDPGIYPPEETRKRLLVLKTPTDDEARIMNRIWTQIKTGQ